MKIAIITLPLHTNYGGILQTYAMQKVLIDMGHTPITIDYDRRVRLPLNTRYLVYAKNAFKHYILRKENSVFPDIEFNKEWDYRTQNTRDFIETYIRRKIVKKVDEINRNEFDAYIVGSDQIWRYLYNRDFPGTRNAFLEFAKEWNVKRIAYAASFGTDEWEYSQEETLECAKLAKLFNAISVRESSAVNICKEKLGVGAAHILDPTMLVPTEEYIKLFQEAEIPESSGNLICYILDRNNETSQIINEIATRKNLTPFYTNSKAEDPNAPISERIQPPVERWLRSFYDAEFVITDSFHACVFSILFKKPFIVYGNKSRGMARFSSLLKTFGLEERLVSSPLEAANIIDKLIDWREVYEILTKLQAKSMDFLQVSL